MLFIVRERSKITIENKFKNTPILTQKPTSLKEKKAKKTTDFVAHFLSKQKTKSIKNLEASAQALQPASNAAASSQNYAEQLGKAAAQLEQLNSMYASQATSAQDHSKFNAQVAQNAEQLRQQMEALSTNMANLNQVYGGMLNAMNSK